MKKFFEQRLWKRATSTSSGFIQWTPVDDTGSKKARAIQTFIFRRHGLGRMKMNRSSNECQAIFGSQCCGSVENAGVEVDEMRLDNFGCGPKSHIQIQQLQSYFRISTYSSPLVKIRQHLIFKTIVFINVPAIQIHPFDERFGSYIQWQPPWMIKWRASTRPIVPEITAHRADICNRPKPVIPLFTKKCLLDWYKVVLITLLDINRVESQHKWPKRRCVWYIVAWYPHLHMKLLPELAARSPTHQRVPISFDLAMGIPNNRFSVFHIWTLKVLDRFCVRILMMRDIIIIVGPFRKSPCWCWETEKVLSHICTMAVPFRLFNLLGSSRLEGYKSCKARFSSFAVSIRWKNMLSTTQLVICDINTQVKGCFESIQTALLCRVRGVYGFSGALGYSLVFREDYLEFDTL